MEGNFDFEYLTTVIYQNRSAVEQAHRWVGGLRSLWFSFVAGVGQFFFLIRQA